MIWAVWFELSPLGVMGLALLMRFAREQDRASRWYGPVMWVCGVLALPLLWATLIAFGTVLLIR